MKCCLEVRIPAFGSERGERPAIDLIPFLLLMSCRESWVHNPVIWLLLRQTCNGWCKSDEWGSALQEISACNTNAICEEMPLTIRPFTVSSVLPCIFLVQALWAEQLWLQYPTASYKIVGVVHIFAPKWPQVVKANLQPGFRLTIIMYNCSPLDTLDVSLNLIPQAKHVPRRINWVNMISECNQSRRKSTQFPHCHIWLQILR